MPTVRGAWYRAWKCRREWWLARGAPVTARLESPLAGQAFRHHLLLRGTVRRPALGSARVACLVNGHEVAAWTIAGGSGGVPFEALVPGRDLPSGRWLWLRLVASVDERPRPVLLDSLPIRRTRRAVPPIPRHEYGRVWDREVRVHDAASARLAVAGCADRDEWQRSGAATAGHVHDRLGLSPAAVVLEIGCGAARVGVHLAPRVATWIGADTSARMLAHARRALAGHGNVRLVHLDGYDLHGVDGASVDAVYCTTVFMHLDEWDRYRYVEEAHRVLRPGGGLYIDNFDLRSPDGWQLFLETAKLDPAARPANVSRASTEQELVWYVERAGFVDTRVETGQLFVTVVARKAARGGS